MSLNIVRDVALFFFLAFLWLPSGQKNRKKQLNQPKLKLRAAMSNGLTKPSKVTSSCFILFKIVRPSTYLSYHHNVFRRKKVIIQRSVHVINNSLRIRLMEKNLLQWHFLIVSSKKINESKYFWLELMTAL